MNSITYRITGLMFLMVLFTVVSLVTLAEWQMTDLFHSYLQVGGHQVVHGQMLGVSEMSYLSSVHRALFWVGLAILLFGLIVSFALARSITVPLRKLNLAAGEIAEGHFGTKVIVESTDEVGQLAYAFNHMTETLAVNNRLRQRLLVDIAHELKTPLTVIQGNLEGMLDGVVATGHEQLTSLLEETTYLNRLIKDLRELSLAEAGQLILEKQTTDLSLLVSRAVHMLKPLAEDKSIVINMNQVEAVVSVIDIRRVNQVVYNLITNAIRYTPASGQITVTVDQASEDGRGWARICIQDSGPGIAPDHLPHIFDHFYRVDTSRDRRSGGSGIGLAIVKQLVELHGGKVTVESELGVGSRFYIFFPK